MRFVSGKTRYILAILIVGLGLIAIYVALSLVNHDSLPTPLIVHAKLSCGLEDNTFCSTLATYRILIDRRDVASIEANQQTTTRSCADTANLSYCGGIQSSGTVVVFKVVRDQAPLLFTRNQYVAYCTSYLASVAPLHYVSSRLNGSLMQLEYLDMSQAQQYTLVFAKQGNHWVFEYPTLGRV